MEVAELMDVIMSQEPNLATFRKLLMVHPYLVHHMHEETKGFTLHLCAKWDTIFHRDGLLTNILLYEFGADPNSNFKGSLALYWAANQISLKVPDYGAAKCILAHRDFDISRRYIDRGCAYSVICVKYGNLSYLLEYLLKAEKCRVLMKQRNELKKKLASMFLLSKQRFI